MRTKSVENQSLMPPYPPAKMRVGMLALLLAVVLAGCTKDPAAIEPEKDPQTSENPYEITQDEALENMYELMDQLYGPGTRASARTAVKIETLKSSDFGPATRAAGGEELPENLAYVVNFSNDQGFAVLGADERMSDVFCITEGGNFTAEEMSVIASGGTFPEGEEPVDLFAKELVVWGMVDAQKTSFSSTTSGLSKPGWATVSKVGPYVRTKWDQGYPYNMWCPRDCPAGCGAIAMAQLIAFIEWPSPKKFKKTIWSSWYELKNNDYNEDRGWFEPYWDPYGYHRNWNYGMQVHPDPYKARLEDHLAAFISAIGNNILMKYKKSGSSTTVWNAYMYAVRLGYRVKYNVGYKLDNVWESLNSYRPYMLGVMRSDVDDSGHIWLIDGAITQKRRVDTSDSGKITYEYRDLLHCNYGWGGTADGYYWSGGFDPGPDGGPVYREPDFDEGRTTNPNAGHYNIQTFGLQIF